MEHSYDDWMAKANEALEISLVQPTAPSGLRTVATFHPIFTYPLFGDEETILGYKDLKIQLRFHASDMRPNLRVTSSKKLDAVGDKEATDIQGVLKDFLPPVAFQTPKEFETATVASAEGTATFSPPGRRLRTFQCADGRYEIWTGALADAPVKQLVNRVQIFVPLFIEGGTYIGTEESADEADRWTLFFLYRTRQAAGHTDVYEYEFAGYSTVYRFLLPVQNGREEEKEKGKKEEGKGNKKEGEDGQNKEQELDLSQSTTGEFALATLPCRSRLSQFIILPPFQGKGLAGRLYGAIYRHYLQEPQTVELTVEDPNEAFDDVRDLADLAFLTTSRPEFAPNGKGLVHLDASVAIPRSGAAPSNIVVDDPAKLEALRRSVKIAPRQFHRVVEMFLMQQLPETVRPSLEEGEGEEEEEEGEEGNSAAEKQKQKQIPKQKQKNAPIKEDLHLYQLWRLFVKQRLYRHNRELLGQLERSERIEKLDQTLVSVELEYARLLSKFGAAVERAAAHPDTVLFDADAANKEDGNKNSTATTAETKTLPVVPGKRKLDDGQGTDAAEEDDSPSSKKVRVEAGKA